MADLEIWHLRQFSFDRFKFIVVVNFHFQEQRQFGFNVSAEVLVLPGLDRLLPLRGLTPQNAVITRQNYLHEVLVSEEALEGTVEELDHVIAFELGELLPLLVPVHVAHHVLAGDDSGVVPVYSGEAGVRLEIHDFGKLLPL